MTDTPAKLTAEARAFAASDADLVDQVRDAALSIAADNPKLSALLHVCDRALRTCDDLVQLLNDDLDRQSREIETLRAFVVMVHEIVAPKPHGDFDINVGLKEQCYNELRRKIYASPPPSPSFTEEQIKHMVSRFLGWRLPENFRPDAGISFKANYNEHTAHPMKHEPLGTNLFDVNQADAMVRYMIEGMPAPPPSPSEEPRK